jgi:hypothetical protein
MPKLTHRLSGLMMASSFLALSFLTAYAFAADVVTPGDFFAQVLDVITKFGGLTFVLKVAAIITLVISSMKVSVLNDLIWSKLGAFQAWVAPILGLLAGILHLADNGASISWASVFAYLSAGAGAIILHELLDSVKALPGLGEFWVGLIAAVEKLLGGPSSAWAQARKATLQ